MLLILVLPYFDVGDGVGPDQTRGVFSAKGHVALRVPAFVSPAAVAGMDAV